MSHLYSIDVPAEQIETYEDYWIGTNFIVFNPMFNKSIETIQFELINRKKIIFANYTGIQSIQCLLKKSINTNDTAPDYLKSRFNQQLFISNMNLTFDLILGGMFDSNIELPINLVYLEFNDYYNKHVILPNKLKYFDMGLNSFNQPIIFPPNLKILFMSRNFNQPMNLPNNLSYLKIEISYSLPIIFPNIKGLTIRNNCLSYYENLPESLERLDIRYSYNIKSNEYFANLPNNIKVLLIDNLLFDDLMHLPDSIEKITFGNCFNKRIGYLPKNLKIIDFDKNYKYLEEFKNSHKYVEEKIYSNTISIIIN